MPAPLQQNRWGLPTVWEEVGKTESMVVSRKQTPSSRQLGRFAWLLAVIAVAWLLIAVTESVWQHTNWIPYAFAAGFGLVGLYLGILRSRKRQAGG